MMYDDDSNKIIEDEMSAAVECGAEFLDEKFPDWFTKIDISNLKMDSGESCICGQLFLDKVGKVFDIPFERMDGDIEYFESKIPSGWDYAEMILLFGEDPAYYGFNTQHGWTYEFLAIEWIDQIEKRLANQGYKV